MVNSFGFKSGGVCGAFFFSSWDIQPFLKATGAVLQINVVVELLLLAAKVEERCGGLDLRSGNHIAGQV